MAQRKSFLLRLPDDLLDALNRWARDELRSVNAQIEYILRDAVRQRRSERIAAIPPDRSTDAPPAEETPSPATDATDSAEKPYRRP